MHNIPSVLHILANPSYEPVASNDPSHCKREQDCTWHFWPIKTCTQIYSGLKSHLDPFIDLKRPVTSWNLTTQDLYHLESLSSAGASNKSRACYSVHKPIKIRRFQFTHGLSYQHSKIQRDLPSHGTSPLFHHNATAFQTWPAFCLRVCMACTCMYTHTQKNLKHFSYQE